MSKITNKSKLSIIFAYIFITILTTLLQVSAPASAATQDSKDRRIMAAFGYCIINSVNRRDSGYASFADLFDDNGEADLAVVGLDIDKTNGVYTCLEAKDAARDLLDAKGLLVTGIASDTIDTRLEKTLFADVGQGIVGTFKSAFPAGIEDGYAKDKLKVFAADIIQPFLDARANTPEDMADRMFGLVDTCYVFSNEKIEGFTFTFTDAAGKEVWAAPNDLQLGKTVVDYAGIKTTGIGLTDNLLGKINLGWKQGERTFGFQSDWYPLGQDFYNFSTRTEDTSYFGENYTHWGAVLDCNAVERVKDKIFGLYTLDANGETLRNKDGQSSEDIRGEGSADIGFAGADDNPTCESQGGNLSWIICPIINGALDLTDWIFNKFIGPYLFISPLTSNADDPVYIIWKSFRTIGNILLVFGLLFIVFGQAIGGGLVDAYTAKKAMPRILAAAIGINLSFFLVALIVDVFNVLGTGIGQLITAPLANSGSFNFTVSQSVGSSASFIGGGILAIVLGAGFVTALVQNASGGQVVILFLAFVLIPMVILVVTIFGTLVIRRGLIILLAVMSPIAMALFILPNTEKYARQWFSLLIKALIVYPIIVAIFAIADVLSVLVMGSGADNALFGDVTTQLVGLVVIFMPLFLIPFSFKLAGGIIGNVSGAIKGFGDKRKEKYMGNELDQHSRLHSMKQGLRQNKAAASTKRQAFFGRQAAKRPGSRAASVYANHVMRNNGSGQGPRPTAPGGGGTGGGAGGGAGGSPVPPGGPSPSGYGGGGAMPTITPTVGGTPVPPGGPSANNPGGTIPVQPGGPAVPPPAFKPPEQTPLTSTSGSNPKKSKLTPPNSQPAWTPQTTFEPDKATESTPQDSPRSSPPQVGPTIIKPSDKSNSEDSNNPLDPYQ